MLKRSPALSQPQTTPALNAKAGVKPLRLTIALLAAGLGGRFRASTVEKDEDAVGSAAHKLCALLAARPVADWALGACHEFSQDICQYIGGAVAVTAESVVILPAEGDECERLHHMAVCRGAVPLVNANAHMGMAHSLKLAARHAASTGADGLLIMLADMPFVDAALMAEVVGGWVACAQPQGAIVRPLGQAGWSKSNYAGQVGHPVLFGSEHFGALSKLSGDEGAAAFIKTFAAQGGTVTCIATQHMGAFFDIDTADDLAQANALVSTAALHASRAGHEGFVATAGPTSLTGPTQISGPTPISGGQHSPC